MPMHGREKESQLLYTICRMHTNAECMREAEELTVEYFEQDMSQFTDGKCFL